MLITKPNEGETERDRVTNMTKKCEREKMKESILNEWISKSENRREIQHRKRKINKEREKERVRKRKGNSGK